jgi:predicted metal-dependent hydrolase
VTLDWNSGSLAEGLRCYREARFFDAHEHWESVWLTLDGPEKLFLQALIQIAAAFHHLQRGNRAGTASLLRRAQMRLSHCPAVFGGIEVAPLREEVSAWIPGIENGSLADDAACPSICPVVVRLDT